MSINLTAAGARKLLAGIWLSFFIVNIFALLYLRLDNWIESDNFWSAIQELNALYISYLGVLITYYFSYRERSSPAGKASAPFFMALVLSLLRNVVISAFIAPLIFRSGKIEDSIKEIQLLGPALAWLIAPVIGYYFARDRR